MNGKSNFTKCVYYIVRNSMFYQRDLLRSGWDYKVKFQAAKLMSRLIVRSNFELEPCKLLKFPQICLKCHCAPSTFSQPLLLLQQMSN